MTKLPSPDSIWIPPVLNSDRRGFWYRHRDADAAPTEYLLATPARRTADELVEALEELLRKFYPHHEGHTDEYKQEIAAQQAGYAALAKARRES